MKKEMENKAKLPQHEIKAQPIMRISGKEYIWRGANHDGHKWVPDLQEIK